jgi:GAF domain-containing protein
MSEFEKYNSFLEGLSSLGPMLRQNADLKETLQAMVEAVADLSGAKGCTLYSLDTDEETSELLASAGTCQPNTAKGGTWHKSLVSEMLANRSMRIYHLDHLRTRYPEEVVGEGIASIIGMPLQVKEIQPMVLWDLFRPTHIAR